jgi:hypothetical protein
MGIKVAAGANPFPAPSPFPYRLIDFYDTIFMMGVQSTRDERLQL